jgi:hypothetical protein
MKTFRNVALILLIGLVGVGFDVCDEAQSPEIGELDVRIQHKYEAISLGEVFISPYSALTSGIWIQDSNDFTEPFPTGTTYNFGAVTTSTDGKYTISLRSCARHLAHFRL